MAKKSNSKSRKLAKEFTAMAEGLLVKVSKAERERRITSFENAIYPASKTRSISSSPKPFASYPVSARASRR